MIIKRKEFKRTILIMKRVRKFLAAAIIFSLAFLMSCNENDNPSPMGKVNLKFTASDLDLVNSGGRTTSAVVITDFQISIRDVIFMTDHDDDGLADDSTEIGFRGPYQLDLLNGSDAITQTIGTVDIPNGTYQQLRFKFHKDEDLASSEPLFDRSIYIAGTINDKPFELWHDTSENLDVGKNTGVVVAGNEIDLTVNFTVSQFMNSLHKIDLSKADDRNQDGLIEINTNDPDGNKEIADLLKENIKLAADLIKL